MLALADDQQAVAADPRRVRVGPAVTVVFSDPTPSRRRSGSAIGPASGGGRLVARVQVGVPGRRPGKELVAVRAAVAAGAMGFRTDAGRPIPGVLTVSPSADPLLGIDLTLTVPFAATDRAAFADPRPVWRLVVEADGYAHASDPLGWAARAGLLADLGG